MKIEENKKNPNPGKGGSKKVSKKVNKKVKSKDSSLESVLEKDVIQIKRFNNLDGRFLLVKVGDKDRPAEESDIKEISEKLVKLFEENDVNCVTFVTHHAVSIEVF